VSGDADLDRDLDALGLEALRREAKTIRRAKCGPWLSGLSAIGLLAFQSTGFAETFSVVCENTRREYLVIYTEGARYISVNPDSENVQYTILAEEKSAERHVVAAQTPSGGPALRLHLRPYLKAQYFVDGELFQTDGCRE
jgi:hypothetical protein